FGATGFTGRLVAGYLARHAPAGVRVALVGRNAAKLESIRRELGPRGESFGVMVADLSRPASLVAMASAAKVVVNTVGPYVDYGLPVVEACVEGRADHLDITGEPEFVAAVLERFDDAAREAGVLVISCCGFDSIPADLGALFCA